MQARLNEQVREQVARTVRAGGSLELAASIIDVTPRTIHGWMRRGERPGRSEAPYRALKEAVDQARAEHEAILTATVGKAATKGSWRAAAWLLERRYPERWGRRPGEAEDDGDGGTDPLDALDEIAARRARRLK
ncbi:hypothetical protein [Capillimicrobium parvum]|uniref:hypothetical protein n=1 Tax=Capillimicrobium parvum TaxID=2884022 RepID=UPI00216AD804|nr:hypothetical protein [Capillimicrobium parvum]